MFKDREKRVKEKKVRIAGIQVFRPTVGFKGLSPLSKPVHILSVNRNFYFTNYKLIFPQIRYCIFFNPQSF